MADGDIVSQTTAVTAGAPTNQPGGQTQWPLRWINAPGTSAPVIGFRGPGLVGNDNNILYVTQNGQRVRIDAYGTDEGALRNFYSQLPANERQDLLNLLKEKGYYARGVNPGQYGESDLGALKELLDESNLAGVTWERYRDQILSRKPRAGGGGGSAPRYRVSNPDDLKYVFKRVAMETIGRSFSDQEAAQAVQAYQQQEIAAQRAMMGGGVVTEAPSADIFAQKYAQQIAPTEANGFKFLGIINQIFNATRSK